MDGYQSLPPAGQVLLGLALVAALVGAAVLEVRLFTWIARSLRRRWWLAVAWLSLPVAIGLLLGWDIPVAETLGSAAVLLLVVAWVRGGRYHVASWCPPARSMLLVALAALLLPFALLGIWIGVQDGTYGTAAMLTILLACDVTMLAVMLTRQVRAR